jgi:hypothetical protein
MKAYIPLLKSQKKKEHLEDIVTLKLTGDDWD